MDDALSLTFDLGEALEEPLQLLGAPVVTLRLAIDRLLGTPPLHTLINCRSLYICTPWLGY